MTVLIDGRLNTSGNKVQLYFDQESSSESEGTKNYGKGGQIRLEGILCKEYFIIRNLIYQHFAKI